MICITVAFLTSEFLPFVRDTKANGLVHALKLLASHIVQAFSAEPDVVIAPTARRRDSAPSSVRIHASSPVATPTPDHPARHTNSSLRRSRKRHKRRRLPSPSSGCPSKRLKTRSADAISRRHHASLRHKPQDPSLNPTFLDLQEVPSEVPSSFGEDVHDSDGDPTAYRPTQPAIELTPMMHTTV
jgi:hypothetical protein